MPDGRIDFDPHNMAMHNPCHKCLTDVVKMSKANIKQMKEEEAALVDDAES